MEPIYLDHNATTPVDPRVTEAMLPFFSDSFGNASSVHSFGRDAKVALENAREQIASIINCKPQELFFTSGGTESDNIAIFGIANYIGHKKNHLVVGAAEHHAVLEPAEYLHHNKQFKLDLLPVDNNGFSKADDLAGILSDSTALVSVMHANNETGAIQDIKSLAVVAHDKGVLFHTDAVQSIGKIVVDVRDMDVDLLSLTGHKIYGAKGSGALFIREGIKIAPLFHGGSHELKRRPGTENVAGAAGLAKALEIADQCRNEEFERLTVLADYLIEAVTESIPDVRFNGPRTNRIAPTVNFSFIGIEGESIILSLDLKSIAVSSGSACTSGAVEPSHVLMAMDIPATVAQGAVRFSMGRATTRKQLEYVLAELPPIVERLRNLSPIYEKPH